MMRYITLILSALLLLCLVPMPYGFYQLVRFLAMVVFCVMAYQYYNQKNETLAVVFGALALLFQPLFKIVLGRVLWNVIDVVVAIFLVVLYFKPSIFKKSWLFCTSIAILRTNRIMVDDLFSCRFLRKNLEVSKRVRIFAAWKETISSRWNERVAP